MPRCSYTHDAFEFFSPDKHERAFRHDGTNRCWVTDVGNFGTKGSHKHFCIFHAPSDKSPIDRDDWKADTRSKDQTDMLLTLLDAWIDECDNKTNEYTGKVLNKDFVLPGMQCGDINLGEFHFNGSVYLDSAVIHGDIDLRSSVFDYSVSFASAIFKGYTEFDKTVFGSSVFFYNATFMQLVSFESAVFKGDASFHNATFKSASVFRSSKFEPGTETNFSSVIFRDIVWFDSASIWDAYFLYTKFETLAVFEDCRFIRPPKFYNTVLHQGIYFHGCKFEDVKSSEAPSAYRTLKLAMANIKSRKEEADFYALEQESLRNQPDTEISVKLFSLFYQWFSDYGRSLVRPLGWLLGIHVFLVMLYSGMLLMHIKSSDLYPYVFQFTMQQLVRPFNIWTAKGAEEITTKVGDSIFVFQTLATLQSLVSIAMITLFLLAVRRRFKLG